MILGILYSTTSCLHITIAPETALHSLLISNIYISLGILSFAIQISFRKKTPGVLIGAKIIRYISSGELDRSKSITQELKWIATPVVNMVVFKPGFSHDIEVQQSGAWPHCEPAIFAAILEPTGTWTAPCRALNIQISVLCKLLAYVRTRGD